MNPNRRDFLIRSSLLSVAPTIPAFLAGTARGLESQLDDRILVVVQMDGGNDGLNTVVPFADDEYGKNRAQLRLQNDRLIKLNDQVALHRSMGGFHELWESERLAIVQGVGYPNPNRSHDVSMAIWQTCSMDREEHKGHGWLGRALDRSGAPQDGSPSSVLVGNEQPPTAIRGRRSIAAAINGLREYELSTTTPAATSSVGDTSVDLASFMQRSSLDAYATAQKLSELAAQPDSGGRYPSTTLGNRLKLVSRLIKAGLGTRVFYAVQSGYDTHAAQLITHSRLLSELTRAVHAFLDDMRASQLGERVVVLCFSEFGRRVKENASLGTDHGTAGPVFLAGERVQPGLHAEMPSLTDLEEDDLKMSVDFRRVYAAVLNGWLGIDPVASLRGEWEPLDVLQG